MSLERENEKLKAALVDAIAYLERMPPVPATRIKVSELKRLLAESAGPQLQDVSGSWKKDLFTPAGQKIGLWFESGAFGLDMGKPLPAGKGAMWPITRRDADEIIDLLTRSRSQLPTK